MKKGKGCFVLTYQEAIDLKMKRRAARIKPVIIVRVK